MLALCFDTEIEVDKDVEGAMENGKPIPYLRYEDLKKKPDYIKVNHLDTLFLHLFYAGVNFF